MSFLTHFKKLLQNFKNFLFSWNFLLTDWLTDSLTHLLMPSYKHNRITAKATGLIFALFDVVSSKDVLFHQMQQLQCLHHGSTKAYLCSPFLSPLPHRWRFVVHALWPQCKTRVSGELVGALLTLFFAWNVANMFEKLEAKRSVVIHHD